MHHLTGKSAIITGAGQGVGRGVALALARRGANVALLGRTNASLETVADAVRAAGGEAMAVTCDVKDPAAISAAVSLVGRKWGGLDILVNNAQQVPLGALQDVDDEAFCAGFESGPLAAFRLMKACRPLMQGRGGVMLNVDRCAAVRWDRCGYGAYGAVKEATRVLTRAAAAEWGPEGIRVLAIAPHANSPGLKGWIEHNPAEAEAFFRSIPLRRIGDCETDIGEAVAELCGPAFGYLTGATIPLDGGQARFS